MPVHSFTASGFQWPWLSTLDPGMSCWYFPASPLMCCTPLTAPVQWQLTLSKTKQCQLTLSKNYLKLCNVIWSNLKICPCNVITSFNSATFFLISLLALPRSRFLAFMLNALHSVGKSLSLHKKNEIDDMDHFCSNDNEKSFKSYFPIRSKYSSLPAFFLYSGYWQVHSKCIISSGWL